MNTFPTYARQFSYRDAVLHGKNNNSANTFDMAFSKAIQDHPEEATFITYAQKWAKPILKILDPNSNWKCISSNSCHPAIQYRMTDQLETLIPLRPIGEGGFKKVKLKLWLRSDGKNELLARYRVVKTLPYMLEKNELFLQKLYPNNSLHFKLISYYSKGTQKERLLGTFFPLTLEQLLEKRSLSNKEVVDLSRSLAHLLNTLHGNGWCHLDVNPANICLTKNLSPVLIDFDLTAQINTTILERGTPGYKTPEISFSPAGYKVESSADMWSFGITLLKMIHPELHKQQETAHNNACIRNDPDIFTDELVKVHAKLNTSPRPFDKLIVQLIKHTPSQRLTAKELIDELNRLCF